MWTFGEQNFSLPVAQANHSVNSVYRFKLFSEKLLKNQRSFEKNVSNLVFLENSLFSIVGLHLKKAKSDIEKIPTHAI